MIRISRQKKEVVLEFETNIKIQPDSNIFNFSFCCTEEYTAQLLIDRMRNNLFQKMQEIREQAYNSGFKDGKNKQKKKTTFIGLTRIIERCGY